MWDRDLLYEGHKVVPYCPRCGTALSSHEVAQGYKDVEDPSVYVRFPVTEPAGALRAGDTLLVWTTTPWTLVSNAAVAVDPELDLRAHAATGYVLAEALVERVLGEDAEVADALHGRRHARRRATSRRSRSSPATTTATKGHTVLPGRLRHRRGRHRHRPHRDRVRRGRLPARRGAGAQRRQPGAARRHLRRAHRPVRRPLGQGRRRRPDRGPARARAAAARRDATCTPTRTAGAAARRCSTTPSRRWYIRTSQLRDRLLAANETVDWHPEHIKHGRFGKLAGEQRRLGALARALLGHAAAGLALRERPRRVHRLVRRARGARRRARSSDPHRPYVDDVDVRLRASAASRCGACPR